uniref:RRM domain-containing protein n=1 Tax=Panagrellus redivivus TaxID=6233 RepID=A0A7E4VMW0_PANRE
MATSSPDQLPKADPNVISPFTGQPYPAQSLDERITSFRRWMIRRYPRHFAQTFRTFDLDYEAYLREPSPPKSAGVPSNLTTPTEVENAVVSPNKSNKAESLETDDKKGSKKENRRKRPNSPYEGGWKSRSPSPSSSGRRNSDSRTSRRSRQSDRRRRDSPDRKRHCASPSPDAITTTPPPGAIEHPSMGDLEKLTIQVSNYPTSMTLSQLASILGECGPIRDIKQVRTQGLRLNTAYVQFWLPESVDKVGSVATANRLNVLLPNLAVASAETPKNTPTKNEMTFDDDSDEHSPVPENATECLFLSDVYTAVNRTDSREDYAILARESLLFSVQQSLKDNHGIEHIYPFRQPSLFGRIAVKCATIAKASNLHKYLTNLGHKVTFVPLAEYMKVFLDAFTKPTLQTVSDNYQAFRDGSMSRKKFFELEEASRQKRHDQFLDFLTEMQVCAELAATLKGIPGSKPTTMEPASSVMTPIQKSGGFNFGIKINLGFNAPADVKKPVSVADRVEESMDVVTSDGSQKTTPEMVKKEIKCEDDLFGLEKLFEGDGCAEKPENDKPIKEEVIDGTEKPMENGNINASETATEAKDAPVEVEVRKPMESVNIKGADSKPVETEAPVKPVALESIEDLIASLKPTKTALPIDAISASTPSKSTPYSTPKKTPNPADKATRRLMCEMPYMSNRETNSVLDKLTKLEKLIKTKPGTRKPSNPTVKTLHMFPWKSVVDDAVKEALNKDELMTPFKQILAKEDSRALATDKNYAAEVADRLASSRGR